MKRLHAIALLALTAIAAPPAHAIDVDAGEYDLPPVGTNLFVVYAQHASRNRLYANGERVPLNVRLDSDIGILRSVHYREVGGFIIAPEVLLPFGKLRATNDIAALGSNSGVGDVILGLPIWFSKPGEKQVYGITNFLILPTGQYNRNDPLSLGENRWRATFQAATSQPLSDKTTLDLVADVQFHGKNDDYGAASQTRKQRALYEFQGFVRYSLSAGSDLRLGLQHLTGGENEIDGVRQGDRQSLTKMQVGAATFFSPTQQIVATVGRDLSVRTGFKEDWRLNLRYLQLY